MLTFFFLEEVKMEYNNKTKGYFQHKACRERTNQSTNITNKSK